VPDVTAERLAQGGGVALVEVDLVRRAVETEGDGLGGVAAVDVVDENDVDLLRHGESALFGTVSVEMQARTIGAANQKGKCKRIGLVVSIEHEA
jgi:hypothetical protein